MKSTFFILRHTAAWGAILLFAVVVWNIFSNRNVPSVLVAVGLGFMVYAFISAFSHVRRVSLITNSLDATKLAPRHRRQIEMPVPAAEAFDLVDSAIREMPDVILMDLTLPRMDGFAAAKLMRENSELKNVPIIAVTAHQESGFRNDAKASGFDAYVTKPIDINWLKELINGLI